MSHPPWQRPHDEVSYSPRAEPYVEDVMNNMHHLALHDNSSHFQPFIPYTGAGGFHTHYQPYPYHSYPVQAPAYPPQLRSEPRSSLQPSHQFPPASATWNSPPMTSSPAFTNSHAGINDIHPHGNHYGPPAWAGHVPVGQGWKHNGQARALLPGPAKVDTLNRSSWGSPSADAKARERKAYHPQPPTNRSDWVMWVGNVPPNTTHEELWKYFNSDIGAASWRGPSSIFLISRSSCAFVNLTSEEDLARAVAHFNGRSLRPWDPRCPRLVCRVRKQDDDLRSGVGAQRGTGMHRDWVKQQQPEPPSPAILEHPPEGPGRRRESIIDVDDTKHRSSASCASTNSSFLARNFPMRCFILKSATTSELEDSVRGGLWRTQRHNEPVLDQAFRTSQEVFLIFGANKSGEFFGFAKMIEPIDKEKANKYSSSSMSKTSTKLKSQQTAEEIENTKRQRGGSEPTRPSYFLLPSQSRITSTSPGEITPAEEYHCTADTRSNTDPTRPRPESRAQEGAHVEYFPPESTASQASNEGGRPDIVTNATGGPGADADGVLRKDTIAPPAEHDKHHEDESDERGSSFHIQWIKVGRLPFNQTRHLRNPWNADREVKVSRDGTEVEPAVGKQLMGMWDNFPIV